MMQQIHKYFFKTLFLIEYGYVSGNERVVITLQNRKILALFMMWISVSSYKTVEIFFFSRFFEVIWKSQ